jgi:hypothetical protein
MNARLAQSYELLLVQFALTVTPTSAAGIDFKMLSMRNIKDLDL